MTLVIQGREHEPITVPVELLFIDGRLDIYPDVQGEKYFQIKLKPATIELQPKGYIGFIPLNSRVAIEVGTRVPVANVEHLLARSGLTPAVTLPFVRQFEATIGEAAPFLHLLATRYAALLMELRSEGLFKTYVSRRHTGTNPSGRFLPANTVLETKKRGKPLAIYDRFDRTVDNPVNRSILAAGRRILTLLSQLEGGRSAKLNECVTNGLCIFKGVQELSDSSIPYQNVGPDQRPVLSQILEISQLILRRDGVRLRGEGRFRLPTFLIRMEDVFEAYTRSVVQSLDSSSISVRDGNVKPPFGAAKLFFDAPGLLGNREVTPDIVIFRNDLPICVIEIKYKPCLGHPDRENRDQALVYALAYGVPATILLYPGLANQKTGISFLGRVKSVSTYKALLKLDTQDLEDQETVLCRSISELIDSLPS